MLVARAGIYSSIIIFNNTIFTIFSGNKGPLLPLVSQISINQSISEFGRRVPVTGGRCTCQLPKKEPGQWPKSPDKSPPKSPLCRSTFGKWPLYKKKRSRTRTSASMFIGGRVSRLDITPCTFAFVFTILPISDIRNGSPLGSPRLFLQIGCSPDRKSLLITWMR